MGKELSGKRKHLPFQPTILQTFKEKKGTFFVLFKLLLFWAGWVEFSLLITFFLTPFPSFSFVLGLIVLTTKNGVDSRWGSHLFLKKKTKQKKNNNMEVRS